jgi:hypothetical protein
LLLPIEYYFATCRAFIAEAITSAVLDQVALPYETVLIEGSNFRMKDRIEPSHFFPAPPLR